MFIISVICIRTLLFFRPSGNNLPYSIKSYQNPLCWHKDWDNVESRCDSVSIICHMHTWGLISYHLPTGSKIARDIKWKSIVPGQWVLAFWCFWISVQFNHSVVSNSLRPQKSQHARTPCPSPTPGVQSNLCPSSRWCHPAISSSVIPFSSYLRFPAFSSLSQHQGLLQRVR